jgi:hypothetical protein
MSSSFDDESSNSLCKSDFSAGMMCSDLARQPAGSDYRGCLGGRRGCLGGGDGRQGGGHGRLEGGLGRQGGGCGYL